MAHERRSWLCAGLIRRALELVRKGVLDTKSLVTNQYAFDEIDKAFDEIAAKPEGYIKGALHILP
jgi:threonine dehydrogenase-like Zn-dependent dehydrogenase